MDFFKDEVFIGCNVYRCRLSYDRRSVFIPLVECYQDGSCFGGTILVNSLFFKVYRVSIIDSLGFGGREKLLKLDVAFRGCQ